MGALRSFGRERDGGAHGRFTVSFGNRPPHSLEAVGWRCSPARWSAPRLPERRHAAWIVVLVHGAPRAVLGGTVERPDDDPAGRPEQPFGGAGRLGRGRVRCRCPARSHARIARVAADPPRAVLGGRELLRRRWLLSGVCVCTAATFSVRSRTPSSTRSPACAGWRSRECVDSTNLALERHLNARHGPRETINRAWAGAAPRAAARAAMRACALRFCLLEIKHYIMIKNF